ncbi:MAG TPA: HEAT repeat domain-containing protein [Schlesneria sp.]|jgi:HEAT repeat protein
MSQLPFASRPLEEWISELQNAISADDRYRALLAITSLGSTQQLLSSCASSLDDTDSGVRALAAKQLRDLKLREKSESDVGGEAWTAIGAKLQTLLGDDDPDVRFESARTLTHVTPRDAASRDLLLALLDDEETQPLILAVVVTAIGERIDLPPESLRSRFQRLLGHPQAEVRENASAVVSRWGTAAAPLVLELITALDDDEPIVRENAAIALGNCGAKSEAVLKALEVAVTDEDEGVAEAARAACQKLQK